jgi:pilus assembly protein TadC
MKKNWEKYLEKRFNSLKNILMKDKFTILNTISISFILISGTILSFLLISNPHLKITDLGISIGLIFAAIGIISYGISLYFDYKQNNEKN